MLHGEKLSFKPTPNFEFSVNETTVFVGGPTPLTGHNFLKSYSGFVQDSGEGRWTIQAALEEAVPAEVLSAALYTRFRSRQEHTFAEKILSAMRKKFGGHVEPKT